MNLNDSRLIREQMQAALSKEKQWLLEFAPEITALGVLEDRESGLPEIKIKSVDRLSEDKSAAIRSHFEGLSVGFEQGRHIPFGSLPEKA